MPAAYKRVAMRFLDKPGIRDNGVSLTSTRTSTAAPGQRGDQFVDRASLVTDGAQITHAALLVVGGDDRIREGLRRLLRHVMSDAVEDPVRVGAGEHLAVGRTILVGAVEVATDGDGRHGYRRACGQLAVKVVVLRFTLCEAEPPPVVVDHDVDMVGIVERCGRAVVGGVVELPRRRGLLPDELVEVVRVLAVAANPAIGREVVLVPPAVLGLWG